jgi:hypothetical protein
VSNEPSLCIVCAWRKDCQKKFMKRKDGEFNCPDYTRDMSIKDTEKSDVEKTDSGHN